jgi:hypothetical protein
VWRWRPLAAGGWRLAAGGWRLGGRAERRLRTLFIRNHKLSTALLPRIDSLM